MLIEALVRMGIANKGRSISTGSERGVLKQRSDAVPRHVNASGAGRRRPAGAEGQIRAAQFAREQRLPYFRYLFRDADGGDRGRA